MTDLLELAERCERASGPDRELDGAIASAIGAPHGEKSDWCNRENGDYYVIDECAEEYTASIDAAMTLTMGRYWTLGGNVHHGYWIASVNALNSEGEPWCVGCSNASPTPALALTAAALRARHAEKADA